jgi:uncharacterized protein YbcV (DUF1398 family)
MFTLTQIKTAHSAVKSGADFPSYIQEIKKLGVISYTTFVSDIHTDYYGENDYKISTPPNENVLSISDKSNPEQFKADLKAHQHGKTDFPTFRNDCAKSGVEKWITDMQKMTCTYYDLAGNIILEENIPVI